MMPILHVGRKTYHAGPFAKVLLNKLQMEMKVEKVVLATTLAIVVLLGVNTRVCYWGREARNIIRDVQKTPPVPGAPYNSTPLGVLTQSAGTARGGDPPCHTRCSGYPQSPRSRQTQKLQRLPLCSGSGALTAAAESGGDGSGNGIDDRRNSRGRDDRQQQQQA